ncbi:MAG: hypothetical protein MI757_02820, partial [Pirellulales bacterium]|nr:hypothetical protein [Pirellulales bacterium]
MFMPMMRICPALFGLNTTCALLGVFVSSASCTPAEPPGTPIDYATVKSIAISPDGSSIATAERFEGKKNNKNVARLWNISSEKEVANFTLDGYPVLQVAFSLDGMYLAVGGGGLVVYDIKSGIQFSVAPRDNPGKLVPESHALPVSGKTMALSPDGKHLYTGVRKWRFPVLEETEGLQKHTKTILAMDVAANGKILATVGDEGDTSVRIWDVTTGKELREMTEPRSKLLSVDISPDGKLVAACGHDCTVRVWEIETGKLVHEIKRKHWLKSVRFAPDGKTFSVACGAEGTVRTWFTDSGEQWRVYNKHQNKVICSALEYSPDGKFLVWAAGPYLVIHHFD